MSAPFEIGLNILNDMLSKGFEQLKCDKLECITFGTNLDFVSQLFEKYHSLKQVYIFSNDEHVNIGSSKNRDNIRELINKGALKIYHTSIDNVIIHVKMYCFTKGEEIKFLAIGSPNFTSYSNSNIESLYYLYDTPKAKEIWDNVKMDFKSSSIPDAVIENEGKNNLKFIDTPIKGLYGKVKETLIDEKYFKDLWKHQEELFSWSVDKPLAIINIPPGTGKTKIASRFLKYHLENGNFTAIIAVPTITLLQQWIKVLTDEGFSVFEWGPSMNELGKYWYDPNGKILVTIYSRMFDHYLQYFNRFEILSPNIILILDECHNTYEKLDKISDFKDLLTNSANMVKIVGLSATLDSFKTNHVITFKNIMGGESNIRDISLSTFYSHWNNLNSSPILKQLKYFPITYNLTTQEMDQFTKYTRNIIIEQSQNTIKNKDGIAAIKRASWLRGLEGGINLLEKYLQNNLHVISKKSAILFVQTNEISERIRDFMTSLPGWNKENSVYIYDSYQEEKYRNIAMRQFSKNIGFCLISEKMLSEGFDLPKVDMVVLHGSQKSSRDWLQKIGRAIRYDSNEPYSVAQIVDIVFCNTLGVPLNLEKERFEILSAISL